MIIVLISKKKPNSSHSDSVYMYKDLFLEKIQKEFEIKLHRYTDY